MRFKFPAYSIRLLKVFLFTFFYLILILVAYERDPKHAKEAVIAFLVVAPFLFAACYAVFDMGRDLLVDDAGVFRILDGRKFKSLKWSDIDAIKDTVIVGAYGRKKRFFHVLSKSPREGRFWGPRKFVFSDEMDNFPVFVRVMNESLRIHGIKVQCLRDGQLRSCDEISI